MQTICLLREQYANIFEALKIGWGPTNNENHEDRLAQILTDLHDGDVPSDNGQEELSDSERDLRLTDKWWRPWRSNWTREQKRLHMSWWWERRTRRYICRVRPELRQRRQEIANCKDMLFGEVQTSDNKVLTKLKEKLNTYLNELPMLGYNSGKYDLNAVKEFCFCTW